jgi:acetyltransferase-like isoleucine patch superfamily enzyme
MWYFKIKNWLRYYKGRFHTRIIRHAFGAIGDSVVHSPFRSYCPRNIYIGDRCTVISDGWIDTIEAYGGTTYQPRIDIGSGTYIGHRCHIIACRHMKIGRDVVIADNVYITDNMHGYEDVNKTIFQTPLTSTGPVTIEDEVWLGEKVSVMPNVTIGKHAVIGSNSVVTKNIPAYSVAVGIPARVIKQYNFQTKQWEKV